MNKNKRRTQKEMGFNNPHGVDWEKFQIKIGKIVKEHRKKLKMSQGDLGMYIFQYSDMKKHLKAAKRIERCEKGVYKLTVFDLKNFEIFFNLDIGSLTKQVGYGPRHSIFAENKDRIIHKKSVEKQIAKKKDDAEKKKFIKKKDEQPDQIPRIIEMKHTKYIEIPKHVEVPDELFKNYKKLGDCLIAFLAACKVGDLELMSQVLQSASKTLLDENIDKGLKGSNDDGQRNREGNATEQRVTGSTP